MFLNMIDISVIKLINCGFASSRLEIHGNFINHPLSSAFSSRFLLQLVRITSLP